MAQKSAENLVKEVENSKTFHLNAFCILGIRFLLEKQSRRNLLACKIESFNKMMFRFGFSRWNGRTIAQKCGVDFFANAENKVIEIEGVWNCFSNCRKGKFKNQINYQEYICCQEYLKIFRTWSKRAIEDNGVKLEVPFLQNQLCCCWWQWTQLSWRKLVN
jgi:hypothetical protein